MKNFIELKEEFENIQVDQQNMLAKSEGKFEVLQLKNNYISKGFIPLEFFFYQNDVFKSPKIQAVVEEIEICNLGTITMPEIIKLSKFLLADMKFKYIEMMKIFITIFAWNYADWKEYDPTIIQHTIPIK